MGTWGSPFKGPSKVETRCEWCKQVMADWIPPGTPHHPDCYKYGLHLMEMGWTPTHGYVNTAEARKAMREQFHEEEG